MSRTTERSEATGSGSYQSVPFSYGNNDGSAVPNSCGPNHSAFHPPFSVPTDILNNLPPTEKLHHIMARTAIFVSEHGGQSEIVLRVKQGDNPTFGFLMPDNQLHPYFRFLVNHPQLLKAISTQEEKKSDSPESEALTVAGGALSLLGSVYGTGEDDDNAPQQESNEWEASKLNTDGNSVLSHKSRNEESASSVSLDDKESVKHAVAAPTKEKILIPKRNHFANSGSISRKIGATTSLHGIPDQHSNQPGKTDAKPLILEPPSFLKRTIENIVEFILRNGKEFEAVLIEQDKTAGRFPFLLASNQYHFYYLKVLQEALESKSLSKNTSEGSQRRAQEAASNESPAGEEFESWSLDPQRKEKFKMVIGPKKESTDQPKPVKRTGVTADEAAAIVLAATRGRSPAFQTTSVADSDTGRASSLGSLSLNQPHKPTKPAASNGEAGDVAVATAIAKTAALATASEADSSDASLTKEQKLKAERLRRAKMFAAMIKSGSSPTTQLVHSGGTPSVCVAPTTAGSNHEEREGSCVPFDAASGKERNYRKKHNSRSMEDDDDSDEDHKHSRKKHRSDDHMYRKDEESRHGHSRRHHKHLSDSEDEYKHEKSHHHHHRRHKHHSNSENEDRHGKSSRHRRHSDSENEDRHGKNSRHRHQHRHRKHDLSEDEDRDRSRKHRRKHRSPSEKREELEEGEFREKSLDQSEVKIGDHVAETVAATVSDAKPSDVTEVPSDLRAKIRAMLLETL